MKLIHFSFYFLLIVSINLAQNYGNWVTIKPLNEKRAGSAGIVLKDGNILIAGKDSSPYPAGSCEIFDLKENKWKYTAALNKGRIIHTLEYLTDGRIIAIGGYAENSCEILDKDFSKWVITDSLRRKRHYGQTTSVLKDGRILLVGGYTDFPSNPVAEVLGECEIYDPIKQIWNETSSLYTPRYNHKATLLNDGRLLISGGTTLYNGFLSSCEIFNPETNKWTNIASMNYVRSNHSATLLPNGKVLVAGGRISKVEVYDPVIDKWEVVGETSLIIGDNRAYLVNKGEYLVLVCDQMPPGWEVFSLNNFSSAFYRIFPRNIGGQVFLKLNDERLLLAGGREIIINGLPSIGSTSFCQMYDFMLTEVEKENIKMDKLEPLISCFPNPFNNSTNINLVVNKSSIVTLTLYNALGQKVEEIFHGYLSEGSHNMQYNLRSATSGFYFVLLKNEKYVKAVKLIYQK